MSKNAEGWVRHRGGKCPVDAGVVVVPKFRSGDIGDKRVASSLVWNHSGEIDDVMSYRLHKPANRVTPAMPPAGYGEVITATLEAFDGPLQWRDRIAEIDSTTQALTTERADLVQKLAGEGFALIGRVVDPVEDMSDWRNWKVGDLIERVSSKKTSGMPLNEPMEINRIDEKAPDQPAQVGNGWWPYLCDVKWHSRPSA